MQKYVVTFCTLVALVAFALPSSAPAGTFEDLCAKRWSSDYAMQKRCLRRQAKGHRDVQRFVKRHAIRRKALAVAAGKEAAGPYIKIFNLCGERWKVPRLGTRDFFMWARCLDKQEKAYKALHPDGK